MNKYPVLYYPMQWQSSVCRRINLWQTLYHKGMRTSEGRTVLDEWEDREEKPRVTFKIGATSRHRIASKR